MATTHRTTTGHGAIWLLAGLGTLLGCGASEIAVEVDILSFIDESQRGPTSYLVPAGVELPEPQTIEPQRIELVDGLGGLVAVETVLIELGLDVTNNTGEGDVEVSLYLTPESEGAPYVYDTTPVYVGTLSLTAGVTETFVTEIGSTDQNGLADAFEHGSLTMGLTIGIDASNSPGPMSGEWSLSVLSALVQGITSVSP